MKIRIGYEVVDSQELNTVERQLWLERIYHNRLNKIHCSCNPNVVMHLFYRKSSKRYSVRSNPNNRSLHAEWCVFHFKLRDEQMVGQHYVPLEEVNANELKLSVSHLKIFIPQPKEQTVASNRPIEHLSPLDLQSIRNTFSRTTLGSLGRELLARAWDVSMNNFAAEKKFYPSTRVIQFSLEKLFLKKDGLKISIGEKKYLSDVLWLGQNKPTSFFYYNKEQIRPIILCPLNKNTIQVSQDNSIVSFDVDSLYTNTSYQLSTTSEYWSSAVKNCGVNYETHEHFFVVGLGMNVGYGKNPIIHRLELIPVTSKGMYINSEKETFLFERLENERRIFIRPLKVLNGLEGFIPTALLIDTEKPCLIEIFDQPENNASYHQIKNRKMQHYLTLTDYATYYWHSYRTIKHPPFPAIKTKKPALLET